MADKAEEEQQPTEPELPPEVDAFLKGKNKYKHPYGDWKPVVKADPLKRFVLFSVTHPVTILFSPQENIWRTTGSTHRQLAFAGESA